MQTLRLQQIDALRGLAAMSVVLYHYSSLFPRLYPAAGQPVASLSLGYLGLHLFFMISGFVIFMTLERTSRASDFLVSRFSRLYPSYWCAVLLTTSGLALMGPAELRQPWSHVAINLTMVQRLLHVQDVDGSYWTLFVELLFYAWALLLYLLGGLRHVRPILYAALLLQLLSGTQGLPLPSLVSTLLVLKFIPWFACGIAVHGLALGRDGRAGNLGLILAATLVLGFCDELQFALFAPAASALLYAGARGRMTVLGSKPLLWLGRISYPLYLLHQMLGYALLLQLKAAGVDINLAIGLVVALMLAVATALHHGVERPAMDAIRNCWKNRSRRPALAGEPDR